MTPTERPTGDVDEELAIACGPYLAYWLSAQPTEHLGGVPGLQQLGQRRRRHSRIALNCAKRRTVARHVPARAHAEEDPQVRHARRRPAIRCCCRASRPNGCFCAISASRHALTRRAEDANSSTRSSLAEDEPELEQPQWVVSYGPEAPDEPPGADWNFELYRRCGGSRRTLFNFKIILIRSYSLNFIGGVFARICEN